MRLAAAGGLPTRYAYGELWDRSGMDLQVSYSVFESRLSICRINVLIVNRAVAQ